MPSAAVRRFATGATQSHPQLRYRSQVVTLAMPVPSATHYGRENRTCPAANFNPSLPMPERAEGNSMKHRKSYDFAGEHEWRNWTRRHFPNVRGGAFHAVFLGLPALERIKGVGFCGRVLATWDEWGAETGDDRRTAGTALAELARLGLINLRRGDAAKRLATVVQRRSLAQIQAGASDSMHLHVSADLEELAATLCQRGVPWGNEVLRPRFNILHTGRIVTANPCLHNRTEGERFNRLFDAIPTGSTLVACDFKQAEPSVILTVLRRASLISDGTDFDNLYHALAASRRVDQRQAKSDLLPLLYSPCRRLIVPPDWGLPSSHPVRIFLLAVEQLREHLWQGGRPREERPRFVQTLTGRTISVPHGKRSHRGTILSWLAQGTVADLIADTTRRLIHHESESAGFRFLLAVYDCCYCVTTSCDDIHHIARTMQETARVRGITLQCAEKTRTKAVGRQHSGLGGIPVPVGVSESPIQICTLKAVSGEGAA
jgi:hypothetical protein